MAKDKAQLKYDEALEQLRDIVGLLEKKEVKIDDLAIKVKDAKKLVDFCRNKLQETEDEITKIINPEELDSEGFN
jgi:exodeoxyribonuclease VII small subunit